MSNEVNWNAIAATYVISKEHRSLESLAEEFGVSKGAITKHCAEGRWVEKREAHHCRLAEKALKMQMERELSTIESIEDSASFTASMILDILLGMSSRIADRQWGEDIDALSAEKLLERLSSLSNSLERILRLLIAAKGGTTSGVSVTLSQLVGEDAES